MTKVLYIKASPRPESYSTRLADAFLASLSRQGKPHEVETLDVHAAEVPAFLAPEAKAKYAVMSGGEPTGPAQKAWQTVIKTVEHFKTAGAVVVASPMWNLGIPSRLKQYIDVIVQPGLTFSYSPQEGYRGLVTGRPALLALARGGEYLPGSPAESMDFQRPYLQAILGFIGFTDIRTVVVEPTLMQGPDAAEKALREAIPKVEAIAPTFLGS